MIIDIESGQPLQVAFGQKLTLRLSVKLTEIQRSID